MVVLPAPFGPSRPKTSPRSTSNETPAHGLHRAVGLVQVADLYRDATGEVIQRHQTFAGAQVLARLRFSTSPQGHAGAGAAASLAASEARGAGPGGLAGRVRGSAASSAQSLLEGQADPLDRRAAVGEHRVLREARQRLGDLERALHVAPGGHDLGQQPHAERLLRVDDPPGEDQVERAAEPDDPRQPLGAAVDQRHAQAALR